MSSPKQRRPSAHAAPPAVLQELARIGDAPAIAEAATVSGEPSQTFEDAAPIRPLKLRAVEEMQVTSSPSRSMP
jgi:hypothetical protein